MKRCIPPARLAAKLKASIRDADILLLLLDYDGTLMPIAGRPKDAIPTARLIGLLRRLERAPGVICAIVTGRTIRSIRRLLPLRHTWFVGIHGVNIALGRGRSRRLVEVARARAAIARVIRRVRAAIDSSFTMENKRYALSLHTRLAEPAKTRRAVRTFLAAMDTHVRLGVLEIVWCKGAVEARPAGANKGIVPDAILRIHPGKKAFCVAMGDDHTDEDLFRSVRARGTGAAIIIADRHPTCAPHRLRDTADAQDFLSLLLSIRESKTRGRI